MGDRIEPDEQERTAVEKELSAIREELGRERFEDLADGIKSGEWFAKLLASALRTYSAEATPEFFATKYPGLPMDAVIDRQIALAQRYAAIEGGLTASVYTAAVAASIGTAGGASPLMAPAALTAFSVDLYYLTKLQLRLAYDMGVLYGKPADIDDPEDLYELITIAFGVKAAEVFSSAASKVAPEAVRLGVKAAIKGTTLKSLQALPFVGRYLLQRNLIKVGIPLIGIPLSAGINYYSTGSVAGTARQIYRDKALAEEKAQSLVDYSRNDGLLVSLVWAAIRCDGKTAAEEMFLLKDMIRLADEDEGLDDESDTLGLDLDVESLFARAAALARDERDILFDAVLLAVAFDKKVHKKERDFLDKLAAATGVEFNPGRLDVIIQGCKV